MFGITTSRIAALVAVGCALVVAPQALAKPGVHVGKATVKSVHRFVPDEPGKGGPISVTTSRLSSAYIDWCKQGLIGDRTMGAGSNSYDYFGDPCTT
jgi:hypothetical protein